MPIRFPVHVGWLCFIAEFGVPCSLSADTTWVSERVVSADKFRWGAKYPRYPSLPRYLVLRSSLPFRRYWWHMRLPVPAGDVAAAFAGAFLVDHTWMTIIAHASISG